MPVIYDNISEKLLNGLKAVLKGSKRGDFCVGYFNLRGWKAISSTIDSIAAADGEPSCRLIVGMTRDDKTTVRDHYKRRQEETTQKIVHGRKRELAHSLAEQLTRGFPTNQDESGLRKLAQQLRKGVLKVKFFARYDLHAKLYLAHRDDTASPIVGYVGSSNLTLAGLREQGELNIDVLDSDAAKKLADWFSERWEDDWCLDISEELADIIEESWAGGPIAPYEIYIKTAYELSREAIEGSREFKVPKEFRDEMLDFQVQAVTLAAQRLYRHRGVIISDVVGLGKTLVATAVAKTFQLDYGGNALVICPANLTKMWDGYRHKYGIAGEVLSLGSVKNLKDMSRFNTVIIDESHNLRNRDSKRHSQVKEYIDKNDCRVILLTATPYNKEFRDIGSQLRLFVGEGNDLGIRPDAYIRSFEDAFHIKHPDTPISSLRAFEYSDEVDDWRELMRAFMIRRTRSHIKRNYATFDTVRKQHYLTFGNGEKYYFPTRVPKCAEFELNDDDADDQYSALYSNEVVRRIGELQLPRYGIGKYLLEQYKDENSLSEKERSIIRNLTRAGKGVIGFTKSNLFKRLESSGPSFLLSVRRHIIRNAVYLSAIKNGGRFPIGDIYVSFEDDEEEPNSLEDAAMETADMQVFLDIGEKIYQNLADKWSKKFQWINVDYFNQQVVVEHLMGDCEMLAGILQTVPRWEASSDRKLKALRELCTKTHGNEKLLIFTQFKDTAEYLQKEFQNQNIPQTAMVYGGMDDFLSRVKRFSPVSNGEKPDTPDQIRVLVTTDTLSEGQNLQDCRVVVNFDMPWATIRLVQRVGRIDRIGQKAREILCYSFLPENGIERVIRLRKRLTERISESAEVLGSDEKFFEGTEVNLQQAYNETIDLDEQDDETDLISRAYDIWRLAIEENPYLEERIKKLPPVVYSAKKAQDETGTVAYVKTTHNQHILTLVDNNGEIVSQSQSKILDLLQCKPDEKKQPITKNHHHLVEKAVEYVKETQLHVGGQLGGVRTVKHRTYKRLEAHLESQKGDPSTGDLQNVVAQLYLYPFKESARDRLSRLLNQGIADEELAALAVGMWHEDELLVAPKDGDAPETSIICSMGLVE